MKREPVAQQRVSRQGASSSPRTAGALRRWTMPGCALSGGLDGIVTRLTQRRRTPDRRAQSGRPPRPRRAWRRRAPVSSARRRATAARFEGDCACWSGNAWTLLDTETRPRPVYYRCCGFAPNRTCNGRRRPEQRPWPTVLTSREAMAMTVNVLTVHWLGHGQRQRRSRHMSGPPVQSARSVPCKMKCTNEPCSWS